MLERFSSSHMIPSDVPCALVFAADMIAGLTDEPELKNLRRNEMVGNC